MGSRHGKRWLMVLRPSVDGYAPKSSNDPAFARQPTLPTPKRWKDARELNDTRTAWSLKMAEYEHQFKVIDVDEAQKTFVKDIKREFRYTKFRERKGPSRGVIQKCEPHERNLCAPRIEERTQDEPLHQERCARKIAWDLAINVHKLKNKDKAMFYSPNAGAHFKNSKETRIRG